jgi:XTP/dITP diphosphohydrolase
MEPKLLIATNNKGKVREIQAILQDLDLELVLPADLSLELEVEEDGQTYAENATKKALAFSEASGLTALADDSGLEVDALDGAPGLHSARYAPLPNATDADRRAILLLNLSRKPRPWAARFRATVAIASPGRGVWTVEGICPGEIIPEERGMGGFGYDPIFRLEGSEKTMAELEMDEKNRLSHRGQAVRKAVPILIELFKKSGLI